MKQPSFLKSPFTAGLKTACSVLALTAFLVTGGVQAADQGPRHHARGQYDTVTATYVVVEGDELIAIGERFKIPVDVLKAQNKLPSDEVKVGQKLVVAASASGLKGQVLGAGAPIANSTVTLWAASEGAPTQLTQTQTGDEGRFELRVDGAPGKDAILYLVAKGGQPTASKGGGDNPAIALMTVLGSRPPANVVINEMTTVASVWTHAQFLDGTAIKGHALGLRIAAGNVPNFVDLETGGWGDAIQGPLNSGQTPTMANFATLADALSGCVTQVTEGACSKLFTAATPPKGGAPTDTLTAAESIARYPWYQPERLFALLDQFYPVPKGKNLRPVPYMPYLSYAPSAWVLPLKFDGGGFRAGGKAMFDSEGNLWVSDNFTVGWQAQDSLWQGHATKFAPNGKPLSPMTTGFSGGGMDGGTFGAAVDAKDNAWLTSYGGQSITVFDKNGKPLTPPIRARWCGSRPVTAAVDSALTARATSG